MIKKLLMAFLGLALAIELVLTVLALVFPAKAFEAFHVEATEGTFYLGQVVGWFCLLVTVLCGLSIYWIKKDKCEGKALAIILGLWWIGIGVGLAVMCNRPDHLVLDAGKGAILVILAYLYKPVMCKT